MSTIATMMRTAPMGTAITTANAAVGASPGMIEARTKGQSERRMRRTRKSMRHVRVRDGGEKQNGGGEG